MTGMDQIAPALATQPVSQVGYCGAPAFLTPLHSLTGPVGQPFASCLGGLWFVPWGSPTFLELGSSTSVTPT
jgi:hypothetical protein